MDLFIILGVFPLVYNILTLFSVDLIDKTNPTFKANSFVVITMFSALIWLVWGFFTDLWKLFIIITVINNFVFTPLKNRFGEGEVFNVISKLSNIFTIIMIVLVFLFRLKILSTFSN